MTISTEEIGTGMRLAGRCPPTNEARFHSSVEVVGESVEDAAALHFIRLVHDPFDDLHHLVVAQLIACIACREREKARAVLWLAEKNGGENRDLKVPEFRNGW